MIRDQQEELQAQHALYQKSLRKQNEAEEQFNIAKERSQNLGVIVQKRVNEILIKEREVHARTEEAKRNLEMQVRTLEDSERNLKNKVQQLQDRIRSLDMTDNRDRSNTEENLVSKLKVQNDEKDKEIDRLMKHV